MADSLDLGSMLRDLVQQQSALGQQQAALLDLQTELVRLQRLLIERALGERTTETRPPTVTAAVPPADEWRARARGVPASRSATRA